MGRKTNQEQGYLFDCGNQAESVLDEGLRASVAILLRRRLERSAG